MYLISLIFMVPLAQSLGNVPTYVPTWIWFLPFLAVNGWSAWSGLTGNKHYWNALVLLYIDLCAVLAGLGYVFYMASRYGSAEGYYLTLGSIVAVGGLLALYLGRLGSIPRWLLPVIGSWGRRLFAGLATLLLAPLSPGVWFSLAMWVAMSWRSSPEGPVWGPIGLVSSLLYLAPLYRRIAEGTPPNLLIPKFTTEAPDLDELLALHEKTHRKLQHTLARLVLVNEGSIYQYFIKSGVEPAKAVLRTRATIYSLWKNPPSAPSGFIERDEFEPYLTQAFAIYHASNELMLDQALDALPGNIRELTREWLADPGSFVTLTHRLGLPRDLAIRRICVGVHQLLTHIASDIPKLTWEFEPPQHGENDD